MAYYRKKPVVIEAFQWKPDGHPSRDGYLPDWLITCNYDLTADGRSILLPTLEGMMRADPDDWVIRGVKGEIYPCKPDIFAATYEEVKDPAPYPLNTPGARPAH